MEIDVGTYIADLLFEHNTVTVPGLGGFTTHYQPASIDPVQGKVHPPATDLHFNENLVVDDGLLVQYIRQKHPLSYEDAVRSVADYVRGVREAIGRREIVLLPRVGRLYMDYEQKLQFLPEPTNFNLDSFGLPSVQFYPLPQSARPAAPVKTPASGGKAAAPASLISSIPPLFQRYLPLIAGLLIVIVVTGIYLLLRENTPPGPAAGQQQVVPDDRLNRKPSIDSPAAGQDDPEDIDDFREEENAGVIDTEESTPLPGQRTAFIAIGLFGDDNNVLKLSESINKAGYQPFTEPVRNLTRVGVRLSYQQPAELEQALEDIRNRFDHKAFVLRRE